MTWLTKTLKNFKNEVLKEAKSSIPAQVIAFNHESQIAQVQILIQSKTEDDEDVSLPVVECPVAQFGDNEFFIETQIKPKTEGVLFFSHRCYQAWFETGDIASQTILRLHDINDCYFVAGVRSKPNVIAGHQNDGIKLRNKDGSQFIWLKSDGTGHIKLSKLVVEGDIEQTGNYLMQGDMERTGSLTQTGSATIQGDFEQTGSNVSMQSGTIDLTGATSVNGSFTVNGAATIAGAMAVTGAMTGAGIDCTDMKIDGKSLKDHTHGSGSLKGYQQTPVTGSTGTNS